MLLYNQFLKLPIFLAAAVSLSLHMIIQLVQSEIPFDGFNLI